MYYFLLFKRKKMTRKRYKEKTSDNRSRVLPDFLPRSKSPVKEGHGEGWRKRKRNPPDLWLIVLRA